jgi:hypothetical protein
VAVALIRRLLVDPAADPLLAEVRAGGAAFRAVVFTRNRRVMVSTGDGGKTLRLRERFREAPVEVWRAIGCVLSRRAERTRLAARQEIVRFLRENPPDPAPPRRRVARSDRSDLARLAAEFDRVNEEHFGGALPRVPISLSGRMRRRNGHFSTHPLEIVISRRLCRKAQAGEAEKTLRHEMIHLWQHEQGHKPGHGRGFRRWAERLGVHPRATRDVTWACDASPT